jgi:dsDNA-specific endonuclease/ATPase MutS2
MKTERVTLLATKEFKRFLETQAKKEGVSVSELVRNRCEDGVSENEQLLVELTAQVAQALKKANEKAESVIKELRAKRQEAATQR